MRDPRDSSTLRSAAAVRNHFRALPHRREIFLVFYVRSAYHYIVVAIDTNPERQALRRPLGRAQMSTWQGLWSLAIGRDGTLASWDSVETAINRGPDCRRVWSGHDHHLTGIEVFPDLRFSAKNVATHRRAVVQRQETA